MAAALFILAGIQALLALVVFSGAQNALNELFGVGLVVGASVLAGCGFIVVAIRGIPRRQRDFEAQCYRKAQEQAGAQPPMPPEAYGMQSTPYPHGR